MRISNVLEGCNVVKVAFKIHMSETTGIERLWSLKAKLCDISDKKAVSVGRFPEAHIATGRSIKSFRGLLCRGFVSVHSVYKYQTFTTTVKHQILKQCARNPAT